MNEETISTNGSLDCCMNDETLSNKRVENTGIYTGIYLHKDVKEFIKKLKEEFRKDIIIDDFMVSIKEIDQTIDKLAGNKLTGQSND